MMLASVSEAMAKATPGVSKGGQLGQTATSDDQSEAAGDEGSTSGGYRLAVATYKRADRSGWIRMSLVVHVADGRRKH